MQAMKEISQWNNRMCSLGKWPPNSNADQMKTNPVNKAFITTTNDVIFKKKKRKIRHTHLRSTRKTRHTRLRSQSRDSTYSSSPYSQDSTYSSSLYSQDSKYSSSLSIITRFDILIFTLLSNRKTRHTHLRSHRGIRYTHLRFQMSRLGILVFALIREIRWYINLNFAQPQ